MNDSTSEITEFQCPSCHVKLLMSAKQGIEIDYCPECRGVWLDRGELNKLIERSQRHLLEARPPMPSDPSTANYGHHGLHAREYAHRRRSWLQKIFD